MRKTRLIMLDGLPGSGKTTQAKWLENCLVKHRRSVRRYHEFDRNNPLNWVAWWENGFETILQAYQQLSETMAHSLSRWRDFASDLKNREEIIILENLPFQNTVGLFLHGDPSENQLIDYGMEIIPIIESLDPIILYFYPPDVEWALERIIGIRGTKYEADYIRNMERTPYFMNRRITGRDGMLQLWEETRSLHDTLFARLDATILKIRITGDRWAQVQMQIADFMDL